MHWCINSLICVCARRWVRYCTRLRASPRQRQLHVPGPAPSWSWPTFFSPLITPSLIAARHAEAICSTEARRHGDAGRLFGFTVDWPTGKWRSGNGGRVLNSSRGTTSVLWGTYWHYNSTPVWSDTEFKCFKKRKKMKHVFAKSFSPRSFPKTKGSSEQEWHNFTRNMELITFGSRHWHEMASHQLPFQGFPRPDPSLCVNLG